MGCKQVYQKALRNEGIMSLTDITDREGNLIVWENRSLPLPSECLKPAYTKLLDNINVDAAKVVRNTEWTNIFLVDGNITEGSVMWKFRVHRFEVHNSVRMSDALGPPKCTYICKAGSLLKVDGPPPLMGTLLTNFLVGLPRKKASGKSTRTYIGRKQDDIGIMQQYRWKDGKEIFDTSAAHLRCMRNKSRQGIHPGIQKWSLYCTWVPNHRSVWQELWVTYLPEKIAGFTWQVLYRVAATNDWRHPTLPPTDARTHCERCRIGALESINHCLWECSKAMSIWSWIWFLGPLTTHDEGQVFRPSLSQALIGEPLNDTNAIPGKWCRPYIWLPCGVYGWQGILKRSPQRHEPTIVTKAKIWSHIRITLQAEWRKKWKKDSITP